MMDKNIEHKDNIKVGILEDDEFMRRFLVQTINAADNLSVAFECGLSSDAVIALDNITPDICLIDIKLPDGNGIDFIKLLKSKCNSYALILTILGDKTSVMLALESGADGYLLKDSAADQIVRDIRASVAGGSPLSPQVAKYLLENLNETTASKSKSIDNILSTREHEVLLMLSRGLSYKETATALRLSAYTVNDHVKSIYNKMSVHSKNEAIFEAVQNGWLDI